jgi:hypothetical protein
MHSLTARPPTTFTPLGGPLVVPSLARLLDWLPAYPDGIARVVAGHGITGQPARPECCPLAKLLRAAYALFGLAVTVEVMRYSVDVWATGGIGEPIDSASVPDWGVQFVVSIDSGRWPELLDPAFRTGLRTGLGPEATP